MQPALQEFTIPECAGIGAFWAMRSSSRRSSFGTVQTDTSIDRPDAGRGNFQQMAVGIPKVDALASQIPRAPLFDFDLVLPEPFFPSRQLGSGNRKGDVQLAISIVRRRDAERATLLEQQQGLAFAGPQRTTALSEVSDLAKTENSRIEPR